MESKRDSRRRKTISSGISCYKSLSDKFIDNPLLSNKGYMKSVPISGESRQQSITKMSTIIDAEQANLYINKDIIEKHETFMKSLKESRVNSNWLLNMTTGNNSYTLDSAQGSSLQVIQEEEGKRSKKKNSNIEINTLVRKYQEGCTSPSSSHRGIIDSSTINSAEKRTDNQKEDSIQINDSFCAKEEDKSNYLSIYVSNKGYLTDLAKIEKLGEVYREIPSVPVQINQLCDQFQKAVSRHLTLFEQNSKTLVFELQSSLLSISNSPIDENDEKFAIDQEATRYVKFRPYLLEFIREVKMYYELIIYSSAPSKLVNAIANFIEGKEGHIFSERLSSEHCLLHSDKISLKTLQLLKVNRSIDDMICIDCNYENYMLNTKNIVPLSPFTTDSNDTELLRLTRFLKRAAVSNENAVSFLAKQLICV